MKSPCWVKYGLCGLLGVMVVSNIFPAGDEKFYDQAHLYMFNHGKNHCNTFHATSGNAYSSRPLDDHEKARKEAKLKCQQHEKDKVKCAEVVCVFK